MSSERGPPIKKRCKGVGQCFRDTYSISNKSNAIMITNHPHHEAPHAKTPHILTPPVTNHDVQSVQAAHLQASS